MITHHPAPELLLDYAAGSMAEPVALAVAVHLSFCRECAAEVATLESIGGALVEEVEPVAMSEAALDTVMRRLDEPEPAARRAFAAVTPGRGMMPAVLRRYVGDRLEALRWRRVGRMFEEARIPLSTKGFKAVLMRLKPGAVMPVHGHRGREYTLVLAGGYRDGGEAFGPGDFDVRDPSHKHQPVVDEDGECLCLVVLDAPVKLSGVFGRLVNPFLRV